jgi:3D (Asp-Asp-Asp) domain-containing protein
VEKIMKSINFPYKINKLFLIFLLLVTHATALHADDFMLPAAKQNQLDRPLSVWATYYKVYSASHSSRPGAIPLVGKKDKNLGAALDLIDWCEAAVQGTVQVRLEQAKTLTFNYDGLRRGEEFAECPKTRYSKLANNVRLALGRSLFRLVPSDAPFGTGVQRYRLVPYRTIAVDKDMIPFGSVLYIETLRGTTMTLPDGRRIAHDGYVFAGDAGGAIKGNHIDFFIGTSADNPAPKVVQSDANRTINVHFVTDVHIITYLRKLHEMK